VSATAGNAQATVSFTPPASSGGSAITGYTVTSNPAGGVDANFGTTLTTHTVTGLINGTAYTFTVTATNAAGSSLPSGASNSVTPYTVPGAPAGVTATAGNAQAQVTFTAPASNGSAITGYAVTSNPGGITATGTASPIIVWGLTNGTAYTFTVTAANAAGTGPASSASNSVTPAKVPGAPTAVSATAGNSQATVSFTPPASNGASAITGYTVTSNPGGITATGTLSPIIVTGLTNGTAYTFTVTATNAVGTGFPSGPSTPVTPDTVPGAPTAVTATAGNALATVIFTPPASNGGSVITGYTVTSNTGDGTDANAGSTSTFHIVTGLTNGNLYTFTVTATNAAGTGPPSSPSNGVTPTAPATAPGAPAGVSATAGNSHATVSFTPPASNGGSAITGYTVTSNPPGGVDANAGTTSTTHFVAQLTNGTTYTFTVTATNTAGTGPPSGASNPVTPATVPGAPTGVSATPGNTLATVSFTPPASNGGSAITGYTVTSNPPVPGGAPLTGTGSPITVTGLTNGTAYTFTVTATNAVGTGPASGDSTPVIPATAPGAPTGVSAKAGYSMATVSFTPPASNNGSPVTGYTVTSNNGDGTDADAGTALTTHVVTGLTNGTAYTFTVSATNADGTGPASSPSNSVTPKATPTVPSAPLMQSATAGDSQAQVFFTPPVSNGGSAITGYTVISSPGSIKAKGSASPITVTGLTNGTDYTFSVTATNKVGTGPSSCPCNCVTPVGLPAAPTNVIATAGDGQATVSFNMPKQTGGCSLTSIIVTTCRGDIYSFTTPYGPVTVTGLTNNTDYRFTVTAVNAVGPGPASTPSNSVTPAGVPGPPTVVSVTPGNAQAKVSFTAPASNGGSPITSYTVTSSGGQAASGRASPITVKGLTNGASYSFWVTAKNKMGTGPPSGLTSPATAGPAK